MNALVLSPALTPAVLARLRVVPSRAQAALVLVGGVLVAPAVLGILGGVVAGESPAAAAILFALAFLVFTVAAIVAFVFLFTASRRLTRAEQCLYAGDFETATREAHTVKRWVFRADYQLGALYTLALTAERVGAFPEAAELWTKALASVPAFAASRPGSRARALMSAHAALCLAAGADRLDPAISARAERFLGDAYRHLGFLTTRTATGVVDALFDDSSMGAVGVNSLLRDIENRREPRPLAVLAASLLHLRAGRFAESAGLLDQERATVESGLAPHERALAEALHTEAMNRARGALGGGPHRTSALATPEGGPPAANDPRAWSVLALGVSR